jgi:acyl-CoA thioester hydrolase
MTDQMGVVYYANYLEFFEIGRTSLLRTSGWAYRDMEADGYFLPVIHAACDYLVSARYDDLLEIRTTVARLTRVRIDFAYDIVRRDGEQIPVVLARGVTRHAIVDAQGRPRRLAGVWAERLGGLHVPEPIDN